MNRRNAKLLLLTAVVSACNGEPGPTAPAPPPPPPSPAVQLRDVVIPNLPSPYYHFEYDTSGRVSAASFASGFFVYDVLYDDRGRLSEMRTNILVNRDRLTYAYDNIGRVSEIRYIDANGLTYTTLSFSYAVRKLTRIERERRLGSGYVVDKMMSFSYHADGNLAELTTHRPRIEGQQDGTTTVDRFEEYDDNVNVDGFGLIHDEFFDHLVLLPGVQLQKGNPARQTHTGDGIHFSVNYRYEYDAQRRPTTKTGELTLLNGPDAGRTVPTSAVFSYY